MCGRPFAGRPAVVTPVEVVEGLEPTRMEPVEGVAEAVEDLLPTALEGLPVPDAARAGALACRYCGEPAGPGLFCERCGMRLPRLSAGGEAPPVGDGEGLVPRCRNCSVPVPGSSCPSCGARRAP